jgi:hypothetical protein
VLATIPESPTINNELQRLSHSHQFAGLTEEGTFTSIRSRRAVDGNGPTDKPHSLAHSKLSRKLLVESDMSSLPSFPSCTWERAAGPAIMPINHQPSTVNPSLLQFAFCSRLGPAFFSQPILQATGMVS